MSAPSIVKSHDLACPGREDVLSALTRVLGRDQGLRVWQRGCRAAGLRSDSPHITPAELTIVVNALAGEKGLVAVVANSMWVRIQTWELLSRRQTTADRRGGS